MSLKHCLVRKNGTAEHLFLSIYKSLLYFLGGVGGGGV
jgi:hypothetical protein